MTVLEHTTAVDRATEPVDEMHMFCSCTPHVTFCGLDGSDMEAVWGEVDATCVVCADLAEHLCERCAGYGN